MDIPTGISLIISLCAFGLSYRALHISRSDRKQDREENATRLLSELGSENASLESELQVARWELAMLKTEWNHEDSKTPITTMSNALDTSEKACETIKQAIGILRQCGKDYQEITKIIIENKGICNATRQTTIGSIRTIQQARAAISERSKV